VSRRPGPSAAVAAIAACPRRSAPGLAAAALALIALMALLLAPPADARRVRAFAVGPKFDLRWVATPDAFAAKLDALLDRRRRGAGPRAVQRGADDVASHLLGPADPRRPAATARDLVVLPEDLGLFAALGGSRGAPARAITPGGGGLVGAIASLLGTYAPVTDLYARRYPGLTTRGIPARLLTVALTDTFARTAIEAYARLADRYDVYLEAGVDMVRSWRVVCSSRASYRPPPGAGACAKEDPALVARLRSPDEPARDYAYEATSDQPSNMALVFDPDGTLISKQVKQYLTPIELAGNLDLVPGSVSGGLRALRTPVGTLGFVTSKDAWMPDVVAKLDAAGVDVLVQPELFLDDTVRTTGMWSPDNIKAAGYSDVLRSPSIDSMLLPSLTGNVYDLSADNQQQIAVKPRGPRPPRGFLVGQDPAPGYAAVAPWVVRDPLRAGEPMPSRRRRLGLAGEALVPLADGPPCPSPRVAGPCRGGQVEGVVWRDLDVARRPGPRRVARIKRGATPFSVNRPLAPSRRAQSNVSLATAGRTAWAAFEQRTGTGWTVVVARSDDGGRSWSRPVSPAGRRPSGTDEWWPSVAAGPGGELWVAWQDDSSGVPRAYVSVARPTRRATPRFARPVALDASPPRRVAQWRPSIAATGRGTAFAAWVDERERSTDDALPQAHVYGSPLGAGGRPAATARRLDSGAPVELARKLDHSWAPDVAARGRRVALSWVDFHTYDWRAYERESRDGGATWGAERAVTDAPRGSADESLDDAPDVALGRGGPLVAFTDSNAWRPDLAPLAGGRLLAAFQDERDGRPRIFAATAATRAIP
jgi:hypothetical protein